MKKLSFVATLCNLVLVLSTFMLAGSAFADTPWKRIRENVWEKELEGLFGQATLRLDKKKKQKILFSVTLPCGDGTNRAQVFTWTTGDVWGKATSTCPGWPKRTRASNWIEFFNPLPKDFDPSGSQLKKEELFFSSGRLLA